MPIIIPDGLPAKGILDDERTFALEENVASKQDIRPLNVLLLNLMPKKIETETQILRLISKSPLQVNLDFMCMSSHESRNTPADHLIKFNLMPKKIETETQILRLISKSPLQVNLDFMCMSSHESRNTPADHLIKFYDTFDNLRHRRYDGLIVTGAPVEHLEFEAVDYWPEMRQILDWSRSHVYSTLYICWGALAGLYHRYGINKVQLPSKLFGVFSTRLCDEYNFLTNGFDEKFLMPHSRHAGINLKELAPHIGTDLHVLGDSPVTGPSILASNDLRDLYVTGHLEYGRETLADEYYRDLAAEKPIELPRNYFPEDDPGQRPLFSWRAHANLLYRNWLDYVYQMTPFNLDDLTPSYRGYRAEERVWLPGARG